MFPTDPVDLIFNGLKIKRPKPKIKEKLLELGLAQDRRELRKKRTRKSNQGEHTYSLFPHHDPVWSIPCSGQSHPIPFASVFLTILRFRDYSHSISLLVTRLPATAQSDSLSTGKAKRRGDRERERENAREEARRSKDQFVQDSSRSPIPDFLRTGERKKKPFVDITSGDKSMRMFARSFLFSSFIILYYTRQ